MATKSIEERVKDKVDEFWNKDSESLYYSDYLKICVEIATEQDRISRKEERERCIGIAKEHVCGMCGYSECEFSPCSQYYNIEKCEWIKELRKEIEEGGEV